MMSSILIDIAGIFAALAALVILVALYAVPAIIIAHFGFGDYPPVSAKRKPIRPDSGGSAVMMAYGIDGPTEVVVVGFGGE